MTMPPRATYRLQLHPEFGFAAAKAAIPYLAALGVSHVYLSPVLQAAEGSTHGYDVVDPDRVSEALGGEEAFDELVAAAKAARLGILLDVVPNHMSIAGARNRWWLDVLENGAASYHAHYFDVDWPETGDQRVLLPVLAVRYGRALTAGHIVIVKAGSSFEVRAGIATPLRFPLSPRSLGTIVGRAGGRIAHPELQFIGDALVGLPTPHHHEVEARQRRHRDKAVLQQRLAELGTQPACASAIADELAAINSDPVELDAILEDQHYRLAHWSVAQSQLGYRRFFDIDTLVGIRNEDPEVFAESHAKVLRWLVDGSIDGVRVDHVDGLREPTTYLRRLRVAAPEAWIVVEKILGPGEILPASWPIDGTTGYDFIETLSGLFLDAAAEEQLTDLFETYTGEPFDPAAESRRARLEVMTDALHSELARLTELGGRACAASAACRDYTRAEIEAALREIFAGYSTYRTYLGEAAGSPDRSRIATATAAAAAAHVELDRDLLAFLDAALAFELPSPEARELAHAAEQVTGAIIAKGDEDTLLYRQVRLVSRCEVGSDLTTYAAPPDEIHRRLAAGRRYSLLATSTHDTKRSEDVRARIAVISELPAAWEAAVRRWREHAAAGWGDVAPDRVFEYAMWQTLVGAWPISIQRARVWAEKATREARLRTSWRRPDLAYEAAREHWLEHVYRDHALVEDIARFAAELAPHGDRNSLAQTLVKLTAPGVPDFYQGSELRDDSLVDPDNRRPVDLAVRARMLRELETARVDRLACLAGDLGAAKLCLIHRVLALRRRDPPAFEGAYEPLAAVGAHAHRVFAFVRDPMITVVPRLGVGANGWRNTTLSLPPGTWRDVFSERTHAGLVPIAELWGAFPVALLLKWAR